MERYVPKPKNIFYVYEHWRPDTGQCFYVGKGKANRAFYFKRGHNKHYTNIVQHLTKLGLYVHVQIPHAHLFEADSLKLEIERIAYWRALGVVLVNLTDGGDGVSGYKSSPEKIEAHRQKILGKKKHTAEWKARARKRMLGKKYALGYKYTTAQVEALKKIRSAQVEALYSPELRQEIVTAYANGSIYAVLQKKYHITTKMIKKFLNEAGVKLRGRGGHGRSPSVKTLRLISNALTGRTRPPEIGLKVSVTCAARRAAKAIALTELSP